MRETNMCYVWSDIRQVRTSDFDDIWLGLFDSDDIIL